MSAGICRIKWVCAAAIPLWLIGWRGHLEIIQRSGFIPMGGVIYPDDPLFGAKMLTTSSFFIGIASSLYILLKPGKHLDLGQARFSVAVVALGILLCEGLHVGFTFGREPVHYTSYSLGMLVALSLSPLGLKALITLLLAGFLIPLAVAFNFYPTPSQEFYASYLLLASTPISFGIIGILVNQWHWRDFRAKWLVDLRLARRTRQLERQQQIIEAQKAESELQKLDAERRGQQLLNALSSALTRPVAEEYRQSGQFTPAMKTVCVIACDAVGFSETCAKLQPGRVVDELRKFFTVFDAACLRVQVEPLRAQGDSRIALAGLWNDDPSLIHQAVINAVLAMIDFRSALPSPHDPHEGSTPPPMVLWPARIGITLGSTFIGVINTTSDHAAAAAEGNPASPEEHIHEGRLWFDVWGDTVNVAARLEQSAPPNGILVRESVLWETRGLFDHGPLHSIQIKNTTIPDCAEIYGICAAYRDEHGKPNDAFWKVYHARDMSPAKPNPEGTLHRDDRPSGKVAPIHRDDAHYNAHAADMLNR